MEYKNISIIKQCYGCGVCAAACAKDIIELHLNNEGFYEPSISDISKCSNCGLCLDVCAFNHDELANHDSQPIASYAAWSKEKSIRRLCSSGGVGFEIGHTLLSQGFKVCAVRYNIEKSRAEHYIASSLTELIPSIGSKYIQSYTVEGFKSIDRKNKYLVTGTPCQIDSFRRYIKRFNVENNFILMDFFCHGVPSMISWKKYLSQVEKKTGKITYVSWRNKQTGWHDSWAMLIDGEKKGAETPLTNSYNLPLKEKKGYFYSRLSEGDVFYKLFLGDFCSNPACEKNCKYKYNKSSADIRIGDFWGKTYIHDEKGVSSAIAFTTKGNNVLKTLNCELIEHSFEIASERQMKRNARPAYLKSVAQKMLYDTKEYTLNQWKVLIKIESLLKLPKRILRKVLNLINNII